MKSIRVTLTPDGAYPQFRQDPEHRYLGMDDARRLQDLIEACALILAAAIREQVAKEGPGANKAA